MDDIYFSPKYFASPIVELLEGQKHKYWHKFRVRLAFVSKHIWGTSINWLQHSKRVNSSKIHTLEALGNEWDQVSDQELTRR